MKVLAALVVASATLGLASPAAFAEAPAPPTGWDSNAEFDTAAAVDSAGLGDTAVGYLNASNAVVVYLRDVVSPSPEAAFEVGQIVWTHERFRFDRIIIEGNNGQVERSYADAASVHGPRPAGFDQLSLAEKAGVGRAAVSGDQAAISGFDAIIQPVKKWVKVAPIAIAALVSLWVVAALTLPRRNGSHRLV